MQTKINPITEEDSMTIAEQLDMAQIKKALDGDRKAYTELMNRVEGKVNQDNQSETEQYIRPNITLTDAQVAKWLPLPTYNSVKIISFDPTSYANCMQIKKGLQAKKLETPLNAGGPTWTRTMDHLIMSQESN